MKKIRIKLKSFDSQLLEKAIDRIVKAVKATGAIISGPVPLPSKKEIFTVLKSPHANKDAREQFMQCVYKRLLDIYLPAVQSRIIAVLMKLELPIGVNVVIQA